MSNVPDYWRNQYTTLDAKRAKKLPTRKCPCGTSIPTSGGRKHCSACSSAIADERGRQFARKRAHKLVLTDDDLTGQTVGHLTILRRAENRGHRGCSWHVRCSCSAELAVPESRLRSARTTHCGCKRAS